MRRVIGPSQGLRRDLEGALELLDLAEDGDLGEISSLIPGLEQLLAKLDHQAIFRHPDDPRGAILTIQAGAGGVDAMDWALQLERMYLRYLEAQGLEVTATDRLEGSTAGIHHVELEVTGPYAYGLLRSERGTHRIQHVSAFDANGKKQTSFAAVDVVAIHPEVAAEILENDIEIETMRSGGPGGQGVQTTDSAVRVRHIPSGLMVRCQNHRSQMQNKVNALEILASKLRKLEEDKKEKREKIEASFGHQIRTYVIEPYQLVKDHRSGYETSNTKKVLGGDLEPIVEAYLRGWK